MPKNIIEITDSARSLRRQPHIINACLANGQPDAARFFADLGAPLDLEGAATLGRLDALRTFFGGRRAASDGPERSRIGVSACGYGSRAAAEFLLERSVNVAARNSDGQTALHWADCDPYLDVI